VQPVPYQPIEPPPGVDVGDFEQGSPVSRWALARYLVGRAVAESVSRSLSVLAVVAVALAVVSAQVLHATFLTVLLALVALCLLALRALVRAVLRRLTAAEQVEPLERRLRALVAETRRDVLRELRRIGLPGHSLTLPLLALRLVSGRRRAATLERLRAFDIDRVVSRARLDEVHLLLRNALGRPGGPAW
jgi:hypothetical protein